jgi:hypothetical protein
VCVCVCACVCVCVCVCVRVCVCVCRMVTRTRARHDVSPRFSALNAMQWDTYLLRRPRDGRVPFVMGMCGVDVVKAESVVVHHAERL